MILQVLVPFENGNGNMTAKLRIFFVIYTTFSIVKASNINYFFLIIIHFIISSNLKLLVLFSSFKLPKILQDSPSYRIFGRMHGALNIGKKTNYTV
jgi:hypothetical protein